MFHMLSQVCILEQLKKIFVVKSDLELYSAGLCGGFFALRDFFQFHSQEEMKPLVC